MLQFSVLADGGTSDISAPDTRYAPILNIRSELEQNCTLQDGRLYGN